MFLFQACFQKSGASVVAIRKYIIHKYPSLELERRGYLLKQALKRELERGIIRQVRAALWSSTRDGIAEEGLFPRAWSDRTRGSGFRVPENRVRWDIGK